MLVSSHDDTLRRHASIFPAAAYGPVAGPVVRHLSVVVFTARTLAPEEHRKLAGRTIEMVRKGNGVPLTEAVARVLKA